jgi:hypothetical protein
MADDKCTTPWHASQLKAAVGNITSWPSSPKAMVMGQKGKSGDRHGQCHALQHAARHHPSAHRHVVEREGERAQSSVKDTEQGTSPEDLVF